MKNVTDAFKAAQASPSSVSLRRVSYKRRYWQQSTQSYIWETNWTTLSEADVVSVSAITAKLDTEAVNEFKVSNLTVTLKNADRRWTPTNPFGRFGKDAASPLYGYEPFWTKFRIETGYVVNGVDTFVPLFVGVAVDFQTDGHSDSMQVSVQGLEALLQNANAENVSTLIENETPTGTINGTNKDFITINPGVGIIVKVTIDGVEKKAGTGYSISDLNIPSLGAKITFVTAPAGGQTVKIWYRYWKQNNSIESLINGLVEEAWIPQENRNISTVYFPNSITSSITYSTQNDFLLGTATCDLDRSPGSLLLKMDYASNYNGLENFGDGDYTLYPTWTVQRGTGWSIVSNRLQWNALDVGVIDTPYSSVFGEWDFTVEYDNDSGGGSGRNVFDITFIATNDYFLVSGNKYTHRGYRVSFEMNDAGTDSTMFLYLDSETASISVNTGNMTGTHVVKIIRSPDGKISVKLDGVLKINSIPSGNITGSKIGFSCYTYYLGSPLVTPANMKFYFDDIKVPVGTLIGNWTSPVIDMTASVTGFGNAEINASSGAGSVSIQTRTSTDGISWDSWVNISGSNQVLSDVKRYAQIKVSMSMSSNTGYPSEPIFNSIKFTYISTSVLLSLASFLGKTVYDAIQSLGAFANYEWGFTEDEVFFFRPKNVSALVDETIDTSKNLIEVSSIGNGWDRVYNEVQSEFGAFSVTMTKTPEIPSSPSARFGKRRFNISNGDILIANDTDVSTGIAIGLLDYLSVPRRTCKAKTKLMEWVDLSDTVSVTYRDQPNNWWMGDTHVYMGQTDIHLHGPEANTLDGFLAKVVGYRHDTESKTSEFDLEEIIQ